MTTPSEAGRLLAARRTEKRRTCAREGCGKEFTTIGRGIYCSPSCRQMAWAAKQPRTTDPQRPGRPRKGG